MKLAICRLTYTLTQFERAPIYQKGRVPPSNPYPLDLAHAHIIIAPVVKPGRFRVRMPGHALRDLDTPAVRQVVRDAGRAEGVHQALPARRATVSTCIQISSTLS